MSRDQGLREETRYGFADDFEVVHADDAFDAAAVLKGRRPAVVILDLRSGNAGGFATAREMDQVTALKDIPVLMLLQREQDSWLATQAGAALYRTKPVETSTLIADALSLINQERGS